MWSIFFFFNDTATTEIYTLSLHDALPILGGFCDVMIQAPVGLDPVATTQPYYRSAYFFVYRAGRGLQIRSLDDTILKHLKIGVNIIGYDYTNTPPAHALGARGIVGLVGFGNFLNPDPKAD